MGRGRVRLANEVAPIMSPRGASPRRTSPRQMVGTLDHEEEVL
jgi:hypothetical protein